MSGQPSRFTSLTTTPKPSPISLPKMPAAALTSTKCPPSLRYSLAPPSGSRSLRVFLLGDVAEPELSLVQIQPGATQIRREDDLRQPVAREVTERHAATVVIIAVGEDVQLAGVGEAILEADAGVARGEQGEQPAADGRQRGIGGRGATGEQAQHGHKKM